MPRLIQKVLDFGYTVASRQPTYRWRYRAVDKARSARVAPPEYDLVYVLPPQNDQGWILDAICREIDSYFPGSSKMVAVGNPLPPARAYFYSHYVLFRAALLQQPELINRHNVLFYTHPKENLHFSEDELTYLLNQSNAVVSMCSLFARSLQNRGVRNELVHVGLVGADPNFFRSHDRQCGKIGFCSGYVPRKNGDRIREIVKRMPDQNFALCGSKWRRWSGFEELTSLPNFEYVEIPYQCFPEFYDGIDVFVSTSRLEGGPVPLIESMMSNIVPVCSRTGHAEDVIIDRQNGYLFDVDAPIEQVCDLIRQAKCHRGEIRSTVEHLSWSRFSRQIQQIANVSNAAAAPLTKSDVIASS
jgi:glycosyltransferase involved in cell wall biosynthesis